MEANKYRSGSSVFDTSLGEMGTNSIGRQGVGYGDVNFIRAVNTEAIILGVARTSVKGAKVHGVDLEEVQHPRLRSRRGHIFQGQRLTEALLIFLAYLPYDQLVVTAVS